MIKIVRNGKVIELTEEEFAEYEKEIKENTVELSYEEKIVNEIRIKYSVDDELAILRQRDSKPEEFAEYFEFVENIKQNLKKTEAK